VTQKELDALAALEAGATKGPWFAFMRKPEFDGDGGHLDISYEDGALLATFFPSDSDDGMTDDPIKDRLTPEQYTEGDKNRELCIALRNALPALLADARSARVLGELLRECDLRLDQALGDFLSVGHVGEDIKEDLRELRKRIDAEIGRTE
jgi:hypothetical protein